MTLCGISFGLLNVGCREITIKISARVRDHLIAANNFCSKERGLKNSVEGTAIIARNSDDYLVFAFNRIFFKRQNVHSCVTLCSTRRTESDEFSVNVNLIKRRRGQLKLRTDQRIDGCLKYSVNVELLTLSFGKNRLCKTKHSKYPS